MTGHFICTEMQSNPFRVLYFIDVNIYNLQMSVSTPTNCKRRLMIFGLSWAHRFVYKLYWVLFSSFAIETVSLSSQLLGHFVTHSLRRMNSCLYAFPPQLHYSYWAAGTRNSFMSLLSLPSVSFTADTDNFSIRQSARVGRGVESHVIWHSHPRREVERPQKAERHAQGKSVNGKMRTWT